MAKLRRAANWAFLIPERKELREELLGRIRTYMAQADARSLAGMMAEIPSSSTTAADHQPPQWLFAFDAAGMATFRTLALLASHRGYARQVRNEIEEVSHRSAEPPPYTRAAVMESLRLWPTTPLLLRETRAATVWEAGELPANTLVVIFTPYFHRNRNLPYADVFSPELWMATGAEKRVGAGAALIPFSDGPAMCPGRSLVLFLATAMVAAVLRRMRLRIEQPGLLAGGRLPGTLNHFGIRFQIRPAAA
jgi:cytochrome P450